MRKKVNARPAKSFGCWRKENNAMIIKKFLEFREKTIQAYNEEQHKTMEPWKKQVMELHENSDFLFYFDTSDWVSADQTEWMIQGEAAKDKLPEDKKIFLYDGQARLLGEAVILSDPLVKEEKRRGFLRSRKNEFEMKLTVLDGQAVSGMPKKNLRRLSDNLLQKLSLVSDCKLPATFCPLAVKKEAH